MSCTGTGSIRIDERNSSHWASACQWEWARRIASSRTPGRPSSAWSTRTIVSPTIRSRLVWSSSSYVSLTEPACEFSSGTTPNAASPLVTRENTSRTVSQGSGSASGKSDPTARSLYAPGSPW